MTKSTASIRAIKNASVVAAPARPAPRKPHASASAKTATAKAAEQVVPPTPEGDDETTAFENFRNMFAEFKIPSGRRMLVSVIAQFIVLGTGVYSGFQLGALLAFGAAVLTGSAFLAFLGWFVVVMLSVYTSLLAAARLGKYIALGEIDDDMKRARGWISGKWAAVKERFSSDDMESAHV